jgi:general secretion pathway protein A
VYLNNPALTREEFVEFLAIGFGLSDAAATSKTRCLAELTEVLASRHVSGTMSALVIDEAQCLPDALLEEVRLLANIESASEKLLSIVLAGQPEIADRLNEPSLRQLKQRIGLRCSLAALTASETAAYIAARLRVAGGDDREVFTDEAVATIHDRSRGIPRAISVIADNALVTAFAMDQRPVDHSVVVEVCRDFDFSGTPGGGAAPSGREDEHEPLGLRSFAPGAESTGMQGDAHRGVPAADAGSYGRVKSGFSVS